MDQDMVRDVQCCDDDHGDGDEGDNDDDGDSEDDDDDDAVILTTITTAMLITTVRTMKMMTYATLKDKRLPGKKLKIFFWRIAANRIATFRSEFTSGWFATAMLAHSDR